MALTKIRGEQIKEGVIKNAHIAADAAIEESKLALNFPTHAIDDPTVLQNRKVSDYVQVVGTVVANLGEIDLTAAAILDNTVPAIAAGDTTTEGVFDKAHANSKVIIRDGVTGEPVLAANNAEVYGRTEFVPAEGEVAAKWVLKFYYMDGQVETPYVFGANANVIDWQYLRRFNLYTVSELFAANEKFVHGAADATAHLNILQIAKDIYSAYSIDNDGNANLGVPLQTQIADHIADATDAHAATAISFTSTVAGLTAATEVKGAIEAALAKAQADATDALTTHKTAVGDHAAEVISFDNTYTALTPVNGATAVDNMQAAIEALRDVINGGGAALNDHLTDAEDAHDASAISYVNTTSGLTAVNAQAAIDELDARLDTAEQDIDNLEIELNTTQTGAGLGADGTYTANATANYIQTATSLKDADDKLDTALKGVDDRLVEAEDDITQLYAKTGITEDVANAFSSKVYVADADTLLVAIGKLDAALNEHNTRATGAHAATAISFDPTGTNFDPATVDVQQALVEIDADLAAHLADVTDAHAAAAISYTKDGWAGVTNVKEALDSLRANQHDHYFYEVEAVGGETAITLPETYNVAEENIRVFLNGQLQRVGAAYGYVKTDANTITFNDALVAGDFVSIEWNK